MIRVHVVGGEQLARELRRLSTRLSRKVLRDALFLGAQPMVAVASNLAPRRPGAPDLADNIGISPLAVRSDEAVRVALGPTRAFWYGFYQEFGTVHHGAHPFMRPAFDSEVNRVIGVISGQVWRDLIGRGLSGGLGRTSGGGLL